MDTYGLDESGYLRVKFDLKDTAVGIEHKWISDPEYRILGSKREFDKVHSIKKRS
jgi:hypothetical protein